MVKYMKKTPYIYCSFVKKKVSSQYFSTYVNGIIKDNVESIFLKITEKFW
jgi:hypothetical protein